MTFAGTVALSNCSGSVVRSPDAAPTGPAPTDPGVVVDQPSSRTFSLLNASGSGVGTLKASKIAYGTTTGTDLSLYELTSTYQQIGDRYGIRALELGAAHPAAGTGITVASGGEVTVREGCALPRP